MQARQGSPVVCDEKGTADAMPTLVGWTKDGVLFMEQSKTEVRTYACTRHLTLTPTNQRTNNQATNKPVMQAAQHLTNQLILPQHSPVVLGTIHHSPRNR